MGGPEEKDDTAGRAPLTSAPCSGKPWGEAEGRGVSGQQVSGGLGCAWDSTQAPHRTYHALVLLQTPKAAAARRQGQGRGCATQHGPKARLALGAPEFC